jgi:hypothetical protein
MSDKAKPVGHGMRPASFQVKVVRLGSSEGERAVLIQAVCPGAAGAEPEVHQSLLLSPSSARRVAGEIIRACDHIDEQEHAAASDPSEAAPDDISPAPPISPVTRRESWH